MNFIYKYIGKSKSAKNEDAKSQYTLSMHLFKENDTETALHWLRLSADQKYLPALCRLGNYYYEEQKNYDVAFTLLLQAAEKNDIHSQYVLGYFYFNGLGIERNYEKAVYWFRKAAIKGNATSQYYLGICYQDGLGIEKDIIEAVGWLTQASNQGHTKASEIISSFTNVPNSLKLCIKLAEEGNVSAQYMLGTRYNYGLGVHVHKKKAMEWFTKAAQNGNIFSQHELGLLYNNDIERSIMWHTKAAEGGHAKSQYVLGIYYEEKNPSISTEWFLKAIEQGCNQSRCKLGQIYLKDQKEELAIPLFVKAAEEGDDLAKKISSSVLNELFIITI